MKKVNFDEYANNYNKILQEQHKLFGNIEYYGEYKIKIMRKILQYQEYINILEYGCGTGRNLKYLKKYFPASNLYAIDISKESMNIAKRENPFTKILTIDEFNKMSDFFDLIFIAGVFHHIEPSSREEVVKNLQFVLRYSGKIVVFEHNPYNFLTRKMVRECEFDQDAILLTKKELIKLFKILGFKPIYSRYCLFFPPRLKFLSFLENFLGWLPLGGQYFVVFNKSW